MKKTKLKLILFTSILTMGCFNPAQAEDQNKFNLARDAFKKKNINLLDYYATSFDQNNPLYAYILYWQLNLNIDHLMLSDIQDYQKKFKNSYLGEKLLIDWLNNQAISKNWHTILTEKINPDINNQSQEYECNILKARYFTHQTDALTLAKKIWYDKDVSDESCDELFYEMFNLKHLDTVDVWYRLRLNYENLNLKTLQALITTYFDDKTILKEFTNYFNNAEIVLQEIIDNKILREELKTNYRQKELALIALTRMTRINLDKTVDYFIKLEQYFDERDRAFIWGQIGTHASKNLHAKALNWFLFSPLPSLSGTQLEWRIRSALRQKDWKQVLLGINYLPDDLKNESSWKYWKAMALLETSDYAEDVREAKNILENLSKEHHFYAQLSREYLDTEYDKNLNKEYYDNLNNYAKPSREQLRTTEQNQGIQRAIALYKVGFPGDAMREWQFTTRFFNDDQLLASAEIAMREEWFERSINTANRTQNNHDFNLRYPIMYRNYIKNYSDYYNIDEGWIYGIIRQESRFNLRTKSPVGAIGLMQLMPQTAQQVAKDLNILNYNQRDLYLPNQNILYGTYYLSSIWKNLNQSQVLATAGYNAGPHRARLWKPKENSLEGEIYVETIPFSETRNYVKQVLMNSIYYSYRLNSHNGEKSLKKRLSKINP